MELKISPIISLFFSWFSITIIYVVVFIANIVKKWKKTTYNKNYRKTWRFGLVPKKNQGSKQPSGPWVNICRKVDGKHPPCGRDNPDKGAYPKCRAKGVASKMSDSEKKAACAQKRREEKKDTQTGKGQKPVMTSYKPNKKTNEGMRQFIKSILRETVEKNDMIDLGRMVEMEHTSDPKKAEKIASDHLLGNPRYYCVLFRIGLIDEKDAEEMASKICPSI